MEQRKFKFEVEGKDKFEKLLLLLNVGITKALKEGLITINDAEMFYKPAVANKLRNLDVNEDIVKLVDQGCEFEDIESLVPKKLSECIEKVENQSKELLVEKKENIKQKKIIKRDSEIFGK